MNVTWCTARKIAPPPNLAQISHTLFIFTANNLEEVLTWNLISIWVDGLVNLLSKQKTIIWQLRCLTSHFSPNKSAIPFRWRDLKVRSLCGITWHDPFLPRVGYRSWLDASQRRGEWPLTVWSSDRSLSAFAAFPNHPEGTTTRPTRPSSSNVQFKRGSDGRQRWTNVSQYDHHFRIMAQLDYRVANKIEKKK